MHIGTHAHTYTHTRTILLTHVHVHIYIKNSCSSLFTTAKTWKQPKCPLTDEWIKKMWYLYTMEYYPVIKKNKIMPFSATWIQIEILILSEGSQKEKEKYYMICIL